MQQPPPLDAKRIGEILTGMKKQMAQVKGEMTMMENDATSSLFNNFSQMINQVFSEKMNAQAELAQVKTTLDEIYQGHPDIKVTMEAKAKETGEKEAKKTGKSKASKP